MRGGKRSSAPQRFSDDPFTPALREAAEQKNKVVSLKRPRKGKRGGKRPGAGRKRKTDSVDADMHRGLNIILQLLSSDDEIPDDDARLLASLWSYGMFVFDGEGHRARSSRLAEDQKKRLAFMSYALCAVDPQTYPKDYLAVSEVAKPMHNVAEKTVWNARAKYPADPQKICDVQHAIAVADPAATRRRMQRIREITILHREYFSF
jgi:hypothetical protein